MSLNVDALCAALDNRLDHRLMFQGKIVTGLHRRESVCRQLYDRWLSMGGKHANYELFKNSLRFRVNNGWVMASVRYDPTPVIAAGVAGLGLTAAGVGAYQYLKKPKPLISNIPNKPPAPCYKKADVRGWGTADVLPQGFMHIGNSCYFHASMLMLYQMSSWFRPLVAQLEGDSDPKTLLKELDTLLGMMGSGPITNIQFLKNVYADVQRLLFPPGIHSNQQQDANEFFDKLFEIMKSVGLSTSDLEYTINTVTCDPLCTDENQIKGLSFNGLELSDPMQLMMENLWKSSKDPDILDWTIDKDGNIRERGQGDARNSKSDKYQPPITRGKTGDDLGFKTADISKQKSDTQTVFRLKDLQVQNICAAIESAFNDVSWTTTEAQCFDNEGRAGLYNYRTKQMVRNTFNNAMHDYFVVLHSYDPSSYQQKHFEYLDQIRFGQDLYQLACVVFRSGCSRGSGHFTAALLLGSKWVYYDDVPSLERVYIKDNNLSNITNFTPFMLLFKKVPK